MINLLTTYTKEQLKEAFENAVREYAITRHLDNEEVVQVCVETIFKELND